MKNKKPIILGLLGSLALLFFYIIILSLANSFSHALNQFYQMWYWIVLLVVGFGVQVGLYFYIKSKTKIKARNLTASGGVSAGSMILCCLHHLIDVLPLIGLAALSLFLAKYQLLFIVIGILSNIIGIIIMLEIMQKHNLLSIKYDTGFAKKVAVIVSVPLLLLVFFFLNNPNKENVLAEINIQQKTLQSKTDTNGGVSFKVTPAVGDLTQFEIEINTHSGSLDFNLVEVSILEDYNGTKHKALEWKGSPPSGHHRSGILFFPKIEGRFKLIINDDPAFSRIFEWDFDSK